MNIFVTSTDPVESAQNLDNKRVVKMVLESAQLLSNAMHYYGANNPYKPTHMNHPCSVWVRTSKANYLWLLQHFNALSVEYTRRYEKIHKSDKLFGTFVAGSTYIPDKPLTPFANCARNKSLDIDYTDMEDTTLAYRLYLCDRWNLDKREPEWS
jgi:hypothetical protein